MPDEFGDRLRARAQRIVVPAGDLNEVVMEGRRTLAFRRMVAVAGVAVLAALAVVFVRTDVFDGLLSEGKQQPADGSKSLFADVHGWIAYRNDREILAVDPADPDQKTFLSKFYECDPNGPSQCGSGDPIGWSQDGTSLLVGIDSELPTGETAPALTGLYVLRDDGTRTDKLTNKASGGALAPDGSQVAFSSGRVRGPYLVDLDAGEVEERPLIGPCTRDEGVDLCGGEAAPEATAWSPDGSTIAWIDFGEGTILDAGHENFLSFINPDGTEPREAVARLPGEFGGESLMWSPDGSRLTFWMADNDDRNAQIYVINTDGTGLRQITEEGENKWPVWSPDGSQIAFVRNGTLHTMSPDGSDMRTVDGVRPDGPIAWNPVP